jgi:hypothetical protein
MEIIPADYWLILCKIRLLTLPSAAAPFGGRFPAAFDALVLLQSDCSITTDVSRHLHNGSDQP